MSYNTAYKSSFQSLAGVLWELDIKIQGYNSLPVEISLDGDQPIVIEWKETKLSDAVCPSLCTIKVVNEKDRQMLSLMDGRDALCSVYRNKLLYWRGLLDDCVYEEPYSYRDSYITEITFSDFGILNRIDFQPSGIKSLRSIVDECLSTAALEYLDVIQTSSLKTVKETPATLETLYVNTARFKDMTMMQVLDCILCSLSLRVEQKNGCIRIYDLEYMYDTNAVPVVWKGTDAVMRGNETFKRFKITFDDKPKPEIADGKIDPDSDAWLQQERYLVYYSDDQIVEQPGFYVDLPRNVFTFVMKDCPIVLSMLGSVSFGRTRGVFTSTHDAFVARRIRCMDTSLGVFRDILSSSTNNGSAVKLFQMDSETIPLISEKDNYEIRINLDLLLSPLFNPFEEPNVGDSDAVDLDDWKKSILRFYVPVKIEAIDSSGNIVAHYVNTNEVGGFLYPLNPSDSGWRSGSGSWGDALLAYYKDGLEGTPFEGWATNRQTTSYIYKRPIGIYSKKKDGEYIPMPEHACLIRLSVSDRIVANANELSQPFASFNEKICWQLYRNPLITIVKKGVVDDEVDEESIFEETVVDNEEDVYSETSAIGNCCKGTSPASTGLLLYNNGAAIENLLKNGIVGTMLKHRLNTLVDQLSSTHVGLSGTAELSPLFGLRSDASTSGNFLVLGTVQDLYEDTEKITMTKISESRERYSAQWSLPVCALEEESYNIAWSSPVCVHPPEHYSFAWSLPICARHQITIGPIWETIE